MNYDTKTNNVFLSKKCPIKIHFEQTCLWRTPFYCSCYMWKLGMSGKELVISWSASQAMELIFYIRIASSSKQSLFLRSQISEVVQANKLKQDLLCCASWITFKKLEHELEAATKSANNTYQIVDNKGHVHRACNMSSSPSFHWEANSLDFFKENFNL